MELAALILLLLVIISRNPRSPGTSHRGETPTSTTRGTRETSAEQHEMQQRPRYSTHTCINQKFDDNWHA